MSEKLGSDYGDEKNVTDQLRKAMEAPIVRSVPAPDTAENYASMCPDYMNRFLVEARTEEGRVIDISDARTRRDKPAVDEKDDEDARASGRG